jgi:hypothetical protein
MDKPSLSSKETLEQSFASLEKSVLRVKAERDRFYFALKRIIEKTDVCLRGNDGRFAVQTLDAIDEVAEAALEDEHAKR